MIIEVFEADLLHAFNHVNAGQVHLVGHSYRAARCKCGDLDPAIYELADCLFVTLHRNGLVSTTLAGRVWYQAKKAPAEAQAITTTPTFSGVAA